MNARYYWLVLFASESADTPPPATMRWRGSLRLPDFYLRWADHRARFLTPATTNRRRRRRRVRFRREDICQATAGRLDEERCAFSR